MSPVNPRSTSGPSSVSPKVIVPSLTVIALLVLMTIIGAVIVFVRAHRERNRERNQQRNRQRSPRHEKSRRGGLEAGTRRGTDDKESSATTRRTKRSFGGSFSRTQRTSVRAPPPAAAAASRETKTLSQNVREIVEDGFNSDRASVCERIEGTVRGGRGYGVRHARETPGSDVYESAAVATVPVVSKIERITGNALSNDLYSGRASGAASTGEAEISGHRDSVPELSRPTWITIPSDSSQRTLRLDTSFSPTSLATDETSGVQELSPSYENILALSPPPRMAAAVIDRKYPNVAALARANFPMGGPSNRLLYKYSGGGLTEHIVTQYNPTSQSRKAPHRGSQNLAPLLDPPLSAAFGGFAGRRKLQKGRLVSRETFETASTSPDQPVPPHRRTWSGRSVLELDTEITKDPSPPPLTPPPPTPPPPSSPSPSPAPILVTSPRVRTSAVGYPPPPPPLPPPSILPPHALSDTLRTNFHQISGLSRTHSTSKASVASVPSTVSSFNTLTVPTIPFHGLSPTPPPRLTEPPPPPPPPPPLAARISDEMQRRSISTVFTDGTDVSNLTERELEMEMARTRGRARRASDERGKEGGGNETGRGYYTSRLDSLVN